MVDEDGDCLERRPGAIASFIGSVIPGAANDDDLVHPSRQELVREGRGVVQNLSKICR